MNFFIVWTNEVFALEKSDGIGIKIITNGDLYVESKIPTKVPFHVAAIDSFNNSVPVECDKMLNSIFKMGKTTVRCYAIDIFGNERRSSFVVTVGYDIVQIPEWFKETTKFWISQNISDNEYFQTLNFLLNEQIMHIPYAKQHNDNSDANIPIWIKINAEKWTRGEISDDEFSIVIQWMLDHGIIQKSFQIISPN